MKCNPYFGTTSMIREVFSEREDRSKVQGISDILYVRLEEKYPFRESLTLFKNAIVSPVSNHLNHTESARDIIQKGYEEAFISWNISGDIFSLYPQLVLSG